MWKKDIKIIYRIVKNRLGSQLIEEALLLGEPIKGGRWINLNGCCDFANSAHRRVIRSVDGEEFFPERYSIDILEVDSSILLAKMRSSKLKDTGYKYVEVLDEENRCWIKFKEIDIEQQIKREAHIVDQFNKHAVTWPELRKRMGYQPILMPSAEEVQAGADTPDLYPEWNQTYWKLFRLPELLVQSIDEPWSPAARASAADNSLPMTEQGNKKSTEEQQQYEVNIEKEKAKAKQTAKPVPVTKKDGYLSEVYISTKQEIVSRVSANPFIDSDWISSLIRTQMTTSISRLIADQMLAFYRGYMAIVPGKEFEYIEIAVKARSIFQNRAEKYINKLTEDIVKALQRNATNLVDPNEAVHKVRAVFDALEYRTSFIEDVEIRKAYSFGQIEGHRVQGMQIATSMVTGSNPCMRCLVRQERPFELEFATIDDVPPHHANCNCTIAFSQTESAFKDNATDPSGLTAEPEFSKCPKCGKTAIRTKDTDDLYYCRTCKYSFQYIQADDESDLEDGEKFERCVSHLKTSLRKSHPGWDAEKIKSVAIATCTKQQKGK